MLYQQIFNADQHGHDILNYRNRAFPWPHLHSRAVLICMDLGTLFLKLGKHTETVLPGQCALILPNQLYSLKASPTCNFWLHTFQPSLLPSFFNTVGKRTAATAIFTADPKALDYYRSVCLHLPPDFDPADPMSCCIQSFLPRDIPKLKLKASLYGVLACYLEQVPLTDHPSSDEMLFIRIVEYVSVHYKEELTLSSVAEIFGYEAHYLCRCMKRAADVPFRTLINSYRIDHARSLLDSTDLPVTQIALECGYSCLRTFNRVFLESEGITPREYRQMLLRSGGM